MGTLRNSGQTGGGTRQFPPQQKVFYGFPSDGEISIALGHGQNKHYHSKKKHNFDNSKKKIAIFHQRKIYTCPPHRGPT
jgi:hypothetical protein